MITQGACLPCLLDQAERAIRICGGGASQQEYYLRQAEELLKGMNPEVSPFEAAIKLYNMIGEGLGNPDPYAEIKRHSNLAMLKLIESLCSEKGADISFSTALRYSIAANTIDYGANRTVDLEAVKHIALERALAINDSEELYEELGSAKRIAYIADNAGEIVFDRLFIETINRLFEPEHILVVVRDRPFINDSLVEDTVTAGFSQISNVEVAAMYPHVPGKGEEVPKVWQAILDSDLVIAKGQANFETFSGVGGFYFHFLVKCPLVADEISVLCGRSVALGDLVAWRNPPAVHFTESSDKDD